MSVLPAGFKGRWFTNEEDVSKTCLDPRAQGCMNHGFMLKQFAARGLYTTSSWSWMELDGAGSGDFISVALVMLVMKLKSCETSSA